MRLNEFLQVIIFISNQFKKKPHHLWVLIKDDKNVLPLQDIKSVINQYNKGHAKRILKYLKEKINAFFTNHTVCIT